MSLLSPPACVPEYQETTKPPLKLLIDELYCVLELVVFAVNDAPAGVPSALKMRTDIPQPEASPPLSDQVVANLPSVSATTSTKVSELSEPSRNKNSEPKGDPSDAYRCANTPLLSEIPFPSQVITKELSLKTVTAGSD